MIAFVLLAVLVIAVTAVDVGPCGGIVVSTHSHGLFRKYSGTACKDGVCGNSNDKESRSGAEKWAVYSLFSEHLCMPEKDDCSIQNRETKVEGCVSYKTCYTFASEGDYEEGKPACKAVAWKPISYMDWDIKTEIVRVLDNSPDGFDRACNAAKEKVLIDMS